MRLNESTAISTAHVLLVPYDRRHVLTYHQWMEDPAIREATASDRLTLDAEYENQASWRASHDKLTFIICQPTTTTTAAPADHVRSGEADAPARMVGDVNLFLYPYDDDDDEDDGGREDEGQAAVAAEEKPPPAYVAEIDVMVAAPQHRGKGVGGAAVAALLRYVRRNLDGILGEQQQQQHLRGSSSSGMASSAAAAAAATTIDETTASSSSSLRLFMAKIKADNGASIALFRRLGFEQVGPVNYFGEVKMVLRDVDGAAAAGGPPPPPGYRELEYRRSSEGDA
ncbi:hypothetical protein RB597_000686 [Gaeumannomyces tritici]